MPLDVETLLPGELQVLMEVAGGLTDTAFCASRLGGLVGKMRGLIPFERCVVLHQNEARSGATAFFFENRDQLEWTTDIEHARSANIPKYLASLHVSRVFQRAFVWRAASAAGFTADSTLGERHMQGREGVAANVTSIACMENHEVTTLMRLDRGVDTVTDKDLFFANAIVFYLHIFLTHSAATACTPKTHGELTPKERGVLQWMVEGKTAWEIAQILSISERTVKFHLHNVYTKLGAQNRAQAVTTARRLKLA